MVDDLNQIIDAVAKEMTSATVDANFARRVAERIKADAPRRSAWLHPALAAPLAAACVILAAISVSRRNHPVAPPQPASVAAVAPAPAPRVERAEAPRTARTTVRRQRVVPLPAVQDMNVAPIVVDRVDVAPIVRAERIEIDPIAITRIEIAPMP